MASGAHLISNAVRTYRAPLVAFLLLLFAGCGGVIYEYGPNRTNSMKVRSYSNWDEYVYYAIDSDLIDELHGRAPSAGHKTWGSYWQVQISFWRKDLKNGPKYLQYFAARRKAIGLRGMNTS